MLFYLISTLSFIFYKTLLNVFLIILFGYALKLIILYLSWFLSLEKYRLEIEVLVELLDCEWLVNTLIYSKMLIFSSLES